MSRKAGELLWRRMRIPLIPSNATNFDIDTGLTQLGKSFADMSPNEPPLGVNTVIVPVDGALPASRVAVVPMAPLSKWLTISHSEPYFNPTTHTVHVAFNNVGSGGSPSLGAAAPFGVLADVVTNALGATINGDLGYISLIGAAPTVTGSTHINDATYNQAQADQIAATAALNGLPCTFAFAPGNIDLATDVTHGAIGVYQPGVYCIDGDATIGGGGTITLNGVGTYVFRITGQLTTSVASTVGFAGGANVRDVWWLPGNGGSGATIGGVSVFNGTILGENFVITVNAGAQIGGRLIVNGGQVGLANLVDITVPTPTEDVLEMNVFFWDPHSILSPGQAVPYNFPPVII